MRWLYRIVVLVLVVVVVAILGGAIAPIGTPRTCPPGLHLIAGNCHR